ncbi:hypothetical protein GCM10027418_14150 [Mariniluteicoccus endophyticus]
MSTPLIPTAAQGSHSPTPSRRGWAPGGLAVLGIMLLTRLATAVVWRIRGWEMGDTYYYVTKVAELPAAGLRATMTEYPVPVVWLLQVPRWAGTDHGAYLGAFAALMIGFDLAFCAVLWARGGRHRAAAIITWSVFLMCVGPLLWLRFDMVPAVLVGAAAVFATTRPELAGALLAVGAAIKVWPGSLVAFLVHRRTRLSAFAGFLLTGAVLLVLSLVAGGPQRLLSPLQWQGDRGLQVESIWATPLMLGRLSAPDTWYLSYSRWQAYEVFGPGVPLWLALATAATIVGGLVCLALVWRVATVARPDGPALAVTMLAAVCIIIVTNKTLSPQYIAWLGAPLAALVARVGLSGPARHSIRPGSVRTWLVGVLAVALLSHALYPWLYGGVIGYEDNPVAKVAGTWCLVVRNILLVWLTIDTARAAWAALGVRRPAQPARSALTPPPLSPASQASAPQREH